jgi:hypothetical protein
VEDEFLFDYARRHDLTLTCGDFEGQIILLEYETKEASFIAILRELQIFSIPICLPHAVNHSKKKTVFALYNNYSMKKRKKLPPIEEVQRLAQFLGKDQEPPTWHFDGRLWDWR